MTLKQIEDFFQNLITEMLGLDPALPQNQDVVRIGWPEDGAPAWKRNDDRVFLKINTKNNEYNRPKDITYANKDIDNASYIMEYTRSLEVQLTLYGPNSFDNAQTIANSFLIPGFLELCSVNGLFLDTNINDPQRSPELFNGQWWDRSNLIVVFNEYMKIESTIPYIKTVDITINDVSNINIINN